MSKINKILVVATGDLPNKSEGASTTVFYHFINYLLKKKNNIYLFSISQKKINNKTKKNFLNSFKNQNIKSLYTYNVKNYYNFNKFNFLFRRIETSKLDKITIKKIYNLKPDKVFALDIAAASFAKQIFSKKIFIWLGDLNFSTTWYHFYYNFKNNYKYFLYYFFVKIIVKKWKYFYKKTLLNNFCVSGSNANVNELKNIGIKSIYQPYPWTKVYKKINQKKKNKPSFLFFCNLVGFVSKSAMNYLIKNIYPNYENIWGKNGFKIYICGTYKLDENFKRKIKKLKNIKLMGYVYNLNTLASSCHACLFPIDVPVGNRSRIVTAMGSGWPIIAHENVAIGNPSLISGFNCYLAKNNHEFGLYSKLLYDKKYLCKKISLNAFNTYKSTFNLKKSLIKFGKFINE